MLSFQQQNSSPNVAQPIQGSNQNQNQSISQEHANVHQQLQQPGPTIQTMRLRDDPPAITPVSRPSRKRKSPPSNNADTSQNTTQPAPPPQQPVQHVLPPPHTLIHPPPHMQAPPPIPHGYQYAPADYTPGGMPPQTAPSQGDSQQQHSSQSPPPNSAAGRALSSSKRAEQNRKAQRAFRERRDQHVKALESRSQLLDAALASADEANRRWEECRALVDQLRVENAALRAALSQAQLLPPGSNPINNNGAHQEEVRNPEGSNELKNDSAEVKSDQKE